MSNIARNGVQISVCGQSSHRNGYPDTSYRVLLDLNSEDFTVPDYTMKQIYDAIPPECYERSLIESFCYVFQDLAFITITFRVVNSYVTPAYVPSFLLRFTLWALYTFLQEVFLALVSGSLPTYAALWIFPPRKSSMTVSVWFSTQLSWYHIFPGRSHTEITIKILPICQSIPLLSLSLDSRMLSALARLGRASRSMQMIHLFTLFFNLLFHQLLDWQVYIQLMTCISRSTQETATGASCLYPAISPCKLELLASI